MTEQCHGTQMIRYGRHTACGGHHRIRTRRWLALDRKCTRLAAGAQSLRARTWDVTFAHGGPAPASTMTRHVRTLRLTCLQKEEKCSWREVTSQCATPENLNIEVQQDFLYQDILLRGVSRTSSVAVKCSDCLTAHCIIIPILTECDES